MDYLPTGLIGLLVSMVLAASMSSTSAVLNSLTTTSIVDIYKRCINPNASRTHYLFLSKAATFFWGFYAMAFAMVANQMGTLIEAINKIGSLVYGSILGIFLIAFFFKKIGGRETFIGTVCAQLLVLVCYFHPEIEIAYLWYNVIGCVPAILIALLLHQFRTPKNNKPQKTTEFEMYELETNA